MHLSLRPVSVVSVLIVAALAALGAWQLQLALADDETVAVGSGGANRYGPNDVTVSVGDTVTFDWESGFHNVVATDGSFTSGSPSGDTATSFQFTATTEGTFFYYCEVHATADQATDEHVTANDAMVGRIVVTAAQESPTATPTTEPTSTPTTQPTATPTSEPEPTATEPAPQCDLQVADQTVAPGTMEVNVERAFQEEDGYIVVHETGDSGGPGTVIGHVAISGGVEHTDVTVPLDRALEDGEQVWPMLHTEDNGNGMYDDAATDSPIVSEQCGNPATGNIVVFPLTVSVSESPGAPDTGTGLADDGTPVTLYASLTLAALIVVGIGTSAFVMRRR